MPRIEWHGERLRVGGVSFVLQVTPAGLEPPVGPEPCFVLNKNRPALAMYEEFFGHAEIGAGARVFEIGIWKVGSAAFFAEALDVEKLVAIDLKRQSALAAATQTNLAAWLGGSERASRAKLYFEVDQGDAPRLREIVRREFAGPLDLVIDDGSHLYLPSKRAFETLFPSVRPGGWYVIEDWGWSFNPLLQVATHPWAHEVPLARLIGEILLVAGARPDVVSEMRAVGHVVFVRRGPCPLDESFTVESVVPPPLHTQRALRARRVYWTVTGLIGRLAGRGRRS